MDGLEDDLGVVGDSESIAEEAGAGAAVAVRGEPSADVASSAGIASSLS